MSNWFFDFFNAVDFFIFQHTDWMPSFRDYVIAFAGFGTVAGLFLYSFLTRKKKK